jgi:hypothetical protein
MGLFVGKVALDGHFHSTSVSPTTSHFTNCSVFINNYIVDVTSLVIEIADNIKNNFRDICESAGGVSITNA